jgi:hypothetical protein
MGKCGYFRLRHVTTVALLALGAMRSVHATDSLGFEEAWDSLPHNWYMAAAVGEIISAPTPLSQSTLGTDQIGWSISGGYRFNQYVNVQAGFVELGELVGQLAITQGGATQIVQTQYSAKGETLAVVGTLPWRKWELFLKGGVLFADTELSSVGGQPLTGSTSSQTQHGLVGLGFERYWDVNWSVEAAFTDYLAVGDTTRIHGPDIRVFSTGLRYTF